MFEDRAKSMPKTLSRAVCATCDRQYTRSAMYMLAIHQRNGMSNTLNIVDETDTIGNELMCRKCWERVVPQAQPTGTVANTACPNGTSALT